MEPIHRDAMTRGIAEVEPHQVLRPQVSGELASDDDTRQLVRDLLHEAVRAGGSGRLPDDAVRQRMRALCACARAHGLTIERVLVTLKQEWRDVPEARHLARPEATTVLERIVTLCICEYYAEHAPPH